MIRASEAFQAALPLARGYYQRAVLEGGESLSGSTLRGKARQYAGRYAESRANLLARVRAAGVPVGEVAVEHGRHVLVWGTLATRLAHAARGLDEAVARRVGRLACSIERAESRGDCAGADEAYRQASDALAYHLVVSSLRGQ